MDITVINLAYNNPVPIYERVANMDCVVIYNASDQDIYWGTLKTLPIQKRRVLEPGDSISIDTDVQNLYAKAGSDMTGGADIEVTVHSYSNERMEEYESIGANLNIEDKKKGILGRLNR